MKSPSDQIDQALSDLANMVARKERSACAELIQQMADAEEDQVRKDLLNDCVTSIRRMPYANYR